MNFASSIYLLAIVPWSALALWLLIGRRRQIAVPYLPLWQGAVTDRTRRTSLQLPPLALFFAMLALLLAIFAASQPVLTSWGAAQGNISIIVDRGMTMSARGSSGLTRFQETAAAAEPVVQSYVGSGGRIELVNILQKEPESKRSSEWNGIVGRAGPMALDTRESLQSAIAARLAANSDPILVISDQKFALANNRIVQIVPPAIENVGIVKIGATVSPFMQVMVRVRNQSSRTSATLDVSSGAARKTMEIALPERNAERDYFVDLPSLAQTVVAKASPSDALDADDAAYLVREQNWARLEARTAIPQELQHVMRVYMQKQPPGDQSKRIAVQAKGGELATNELAVQIAPVDVSGAVVTLENPQVTAHLVTENLNWTNIVKQIQLAAPPAGNGWTPIVQGDGKVLVAVRNEPLRQVWIGFDSDSWAHSSDYPVFWKNVFDWIAQGSDNYVATTTQQLPPPWKAVNTHVNAPEPGLWPGMYHTPDGALRAVNSPAVHPDTASASDWQSALARQVPASRRGLSLTSGLIIGAIGAILMAAMTWRGRASAKNLDTKGAKDLLSV